MEPVNAQLRLAVARSMIELMKAYAQAYAPGEHLADVALDVLVGCAVFVGQAEGRPMTAGDISEFTGVPRTTVVRKLKHGQRVEEITGLRAGQYADGWLRWADTKVGRITGTPQPHSIPLPAVCRQILDGMTPNRHGLYVPGCKFVDQPYPDRSLNWIARRSAKMLGIPQWTPRDLRRTWRTLADSAGLTAEECSRIMNHAWGSKIEAKHYDRSEYVSAKVAGMAKWEVWLSALLSA